MVADFYDSSALVKLFLNEAGTAAMYGRYHSGAERVVSRLAGLEVRSAVRRREAAGDLTAAQAAFARASLDLELSHLTVMPLDDALMMTAQQLIERNTIRSLDAIQLASALEVAKTDTVTLVSADSRLLQIAAAQGLAVFDVLSLP